MGTTPEGVQTNVVSSGNYLDWRERATVFEEIGATQQPYGGTLTGVGDPTRVQVADIARSALRVLGGVISPAIPPQMRVGH